MLCCPTLNVLSLRSPFFFPGKKPNFSSCYVDFLPCSHIEHLGMTRAFFFFSPLCVTQLLIAEILYEERAIFWPRHLLLFCDTEKKWRNTYLIEPKRYRRSTNLGFSHAWEECPVDKSWKQLYKFFKTANIYGFRTFKGTV